MFYWTPLNCDEASLGKTIALVKITNWNERLWHRFTAVFHVCAHLKEADLKAVVESNLFTGCTLAFHPKASGRHTGSSLGLRIDGSSAADINLITSYNLPKLHINTFSQLLEMESRKCHPEFSLHWSNSTECCSTQFLPVWAKLCWNSRFGCGTLIPLCWHSSDLQGAGGGASPGACQRISWLSLHGHGSSKMKTNINS